MGCGIGYGYLHRIPIRESPEMPLQPNSSPAPDGFSEVSTSILSHLLLLYNIHVCGSPSGVMVSVLGSLSSGLGSSPCCFTALCSLARYLLS